jgi:hypothetical protein
VPYQEALTVLAPIRPGAEERLREALAAAAAADPPDAAMPFGRMTGVHFARLFVLDADTAPDGTPLAEQLVLMSDVDAPLDRHLSELAEEGAAALDRVLRHCDGYPDPADYDGRLAYLRRHAVASAAAYVNTVGRGLDQILLEQRLRDAVEAYLDRCRDELAGSDALTVREQIRRFVAADEALRPALEPAQPPDLAFRVREAAHMVLVPAVLILLTPVLIAAVPVGAVLLRLHERRDVPDERPADDAHVALLASMEDHSIQNPFVAAGPLKPGPFRRLLTTSVLWIASYAVRHVFNHANLAGVKTIHFARWVFLDGKRRVVFASNYDGSVESYMDDFIDKVWWGLNAVFSNGVGYPRTRWLFFGGARDERAFKNILRTRQAPVQAWYTAYPDLTARNVENNARFRAGLSGTMSEQEAEAWLQRL